MHPPIPRPSQPSLLARRAALSWTAALAFALAPASALAEEPTGDLAAGPPGEFEAHVGAWAPICPDCPVAPRAGPAFGLGVFLRPYAAWAFGVEGRVGLSWVGNDDRLLTAYSGWLATRYHPVARGPLDPFVGVGLGIAAQGVEGQSLNCSGGFGPMAQLAAGLGVWTSRSFRIAGIASATGALTSAECEVARGGFLPDLPLRLGVGLSMGWGIDARKAPQSVQMGR